MLARVGLVVISPLLVVAVLVTPQLVLATYSGPAATSDLQPAAVIDFLTDPSGHRGSDLTEDEVTDVYGNEVTAAVATYRVDATGTLYELHSPQTELPRLGSPKS